MEGTLSTEPRRERAAAIAELWSTAKVHEDARQEEWRARRARDQAVVTASQVGVTVREIAFRVGLKPTQVQRIITREKEQAKRCSDIGIKVGVLLAMGEPDDEVARI